MNNMCGETEIADLINLMQADGENEVAPVDALITQYPEDARLHFLRGSVMASAGQLVQAYESMRTAVKLAPDFVIARFQLGFFELSSGDAASAVTTWAPLKDLATSHYISHFVRGLTHLIDDEFETALECLQLGIALNTENLPLNQDMQLIVDKIAGLSPAGEGAGKSEVSATSILLGQLPSSKTRH